MEFNKTSIIRNLKTLESVIIDWYDFLQSPMYSDYVRNKTKEDLMFVRGLMDDIECDRITEFPMVERTNAMSGKTFLEDADTPYFCSPSSETFWSM